MDECSSANAAVASRQAWRPVWIRYRSIEQDLITINKPDEWVEYIQIAC